MGPFEVAIDYRAERELLSLRGHVQRRFRSAFEELTQDPLRPRPKCDIRRLRGERASFAVRVGQYRALYEVSGALIRVSSVAHRAVAYR